MQIWLIFSSRNEDIKKKRVASATTTLPIKRSKRSKCLLCLNEKLSIALHKDDNMFNKKIGSNKQMQVHNKQMQAHKQIHTSQL